MSTIRFCSPVLGLGALLFVGCQGPIPTLGPLSNPNAGRVPAPATGSFQVPGAYSGNSAPTAPPQNPGMTNRPLTQSGPIGTGILTGVKEEGWHALQDSKVAASSAANSVQQEFQNQVQQASSVAQNGFARITSRLAEETARLADSITPPPTVPASYSAPVTGNQLRDVPVGATQSLSDEPNWRKPE